MKIRRLYLRSSPISSPSAVTNIHTDIFISGISASAGNSSSGAIIPEISSAIASGVRVYSTAYPFEVLYTLHWTFSASSAISLESISSISGSISSIPGMISESSPGISVSPNISPTSM